jgi:UDP-N-acetylglucosamine 2-epimerase
MDLLKDVDRADLNFILGEENFGVGDKVDPSLPFVVILQHPVTTEFGSAKKQIEETLEAAKRLNLEGMQILWLWPNVDAGADEISKVLRTFREKENPKGFHFYKNFSPEDYAAVINACCCIIGNSSSGIREASFLGVPSVNIGSRQHQRERGENCISVDYNSGEIFEAVKRQISHGRYTPSNLFGDGTAGIKMINIIANLKPKIQKSISYLDEVDV